jgi:hypothetical protein
MPYSVSWVVPQRVLLQQFYGHVTLDDVHDLSAESRRYQNAGIPLIHSLVDLSSVEKYPTSLVAIRSAMTRQHDPDRIGWILLVGATNPILRFFASVITQVAGDKIRFRLMDTREQALAFLREHDSTLQHIREADQEEKV